jgi:hypothetical protein
VSGLDAGDTPVLSATGLDHVAFDRAADACRADKRDMITDVGQ